MDERLDLQPPGEQDATENPLVEETSAEYLGRWNRLVSTTNWEKGRIICQWREALATAGADPSLGTDDAWSRRVGDVSPQHVGRLRRVYQRFGQVYTQYSKLYWSHFQAAADWLDAEMWLEGAVQNGWSVAQMRQQRWQAIGAPPDLKPRPEDVIAAELDEDAGSVDRSASAELTASIRDVEGTEVGEEGSPPIEADESAFTSDEPSDGYASASAAPLRPFENLAPLPPDLDAAFEAFKLAILHHKVAGWQEISCGDVLTTLEALRQLALAPAE